MASLVQQHGRFYLQFFAADRAPSRRRVALHVRVKRDAETIRRKLEADFVLGRYDPWEDDVLTYDAPAKPKPERLCDAREAFLSTKGHMSPRTFGEYEQITARFSAHVGPATLVRDVTAKDVEAWLNSTTAGDVTRRTYTRTLKVFARWAVAEGLATCVFTDAVRLRRVPTKFPRFLSPDEVERIVTAIREGADAHAWLADLVTVAVHTGLRRGELVNLQWNAIDLDRRSLVVANTETFTTKSGKERKVPLSATAVEVLNRLAETAAGASYVFASSTGRVTGDYASHAFLRYAREAGIQDAHFHHLRHTACSWLAQRGVPVEVIRKFAGHSSVTVTEKYMHVGEDLYSDAITRAFG